MPRAVTSFTLWGGLASIAAVLCCAMGLNPSRTEHGQTSWPWHTIQEAAMNGASETAIAELAAIYQRGVKDLYAGFEAALKAVAEDPASSGAKFRVARFAALIEEAERRLRSVSAHASTVITDETRKSYEQGVRQAVEQVRELGFPASGALSVALLPGDEGAIETIARDGAARIEAAARGTLGDARASLRGLQIFGSAAQGQLTREERRQGAEGERAINREIAQNILSGDPRRGTRAVREIVARAVGLGEAEAMSMRRLGAQIIEVGGWTGPLRVYAETVIRTRTREATEDGRHERLATVGIDLVQITGRASLNFCTRFIGLVCSIGSREVPGYPPLRSLPGGGPPFHPNCSKSTAAYIVELVSDGRLKMRDKAQREYETALRNGTLADDLRPKRRTA